MGVVFTQGQELVRGDLNIFVENAAGNPSNVYQITYAIYFIDPATAQEVLIGSSARTPVNASVGEYWAALQVPSAASPGDYRIRWLFKQTSISPTEGAVQEFGVVSSAVQTTSSVYSDCVTDLIHKMRILTRDNNPDKNYRMRPPESEATIGCYNQVFGYLWEDEEFAQYLEMALWKWNSHPPETEELTNVDLLCTRKPAWRAAILWGALVNAAQALAYNWVSEEFSVDGNSMITVHLANGQEVTLSVEELYEITHAE